MKRPCIVSSVHTDVCSLALLVKLCHDNGVFPTTPSRAISVILRSLSNEEVSQDEQAAIDFLRLHFPDSDQIKNLKIPMQLTVNEEMIRMQTLRPKVMLRDVLSKTKE